MTDPSSLEERKRLQKRQRFLLRAYIACWLFFYISLKQKIDVPWVYEAFTASGLSTLAFVWPAATLLFIPVAGVYLFLTRRPAEAEESWRDIASGD